MSSSLPLLFDASGPVPTPPETLYSTLVANVEADAPGFTAALPGSLIDDVTGTQVGGLALLDQARVDAVNNISPATANPYVLALQGQQTGVPQGTPANGSALVTFSGSPNYVIPAGFVVGDGTYQYLVQGGGTVGSGGTSQPLLVVCTSSDVFPIPAGSIDQIITTVPSPYSLTVTNAVAGTSAQAAETVESYRARLMQAQAFTLQGGPTVLKTLLQAVPGVNPRLVRVIQNGSLWIVVCGGGDPGQVAGAIYQGVTTVGLLSGSTVASGRNVSETVYDSPDSYNVIWVNPPQQAVTVDVTWNTTLANFTAAAAVNQFILQVVPAYINSIAVGQPINLMVMTEQIQLAVAPVLSAANLTTLTFVVKYGGVVQSPTAGTSIIPAPDAETYLYIAPTGVTSTQ